MSEFVGVVTTIGQQKIAASLGGAALNPTIIRVGDGNGAPITPNPGMTDLVRRVGAAYPIISSGRDPVNLTHWRVTALIPMADGPFDIREIAVFDGAGDMIAIAKHVLVEKRSPAQGAAVELLTDIVFPVSEMAQVTVQVQPSAAVSILQLLRAGFCTVESAQIAVPPPNPLLGATYIVPAGAIGAWNGLTNRLVQWNGIVWVSADPGTGFVVVAKDRALDHAERWLRRADAGWVSAAASSAAFGVTRLATPAEAAEGTRTDVALTPAQIQARFDGTRFRLLAVRRFLAGTLYVPTPGMAIIVPHLQGGGGAGGGAVLPAAGNVSLGAPGTSGAYAVGMFTAAEVGSSLVVTIGAGGLGAAGQAGTPGGTTSLGSLISAPGGLAGGMLNNQVPPTVNGNGAFSTPPTGANLYGFSGAADSITSAPSGTTGAAGGGGSSLFGRGGVQTGINSNGPDASGLGAGGAGCIINNAGGGNYRGGHGTPGLMIIEEYAL